MLHSGIVKRGGEDKLWWVPSKKGLFSKKGIFKVNTFFHSLTHTIGARFPWECVWRTQAPSRASFFSWSAALGKIFTLDNLRKRYVIVINRCCMCKKTEEFVDHHLLHCDVASALWYSLFGLFGLSWVMPRRVIDLLACWWSSDRSKRAMVWKMATICLFLCLWRERNNRSFEDVEKTSEELLSSFYHTLYLWTMAYVLPLSFSLIFLLVSLVRRFLLYTSSVLRGASRF
jgi:hypothetical protein